MPKGETVLRPAKPNSGFRFPYFLYIPNHIDTTTAKPIIVEPNNSGFVSDNFDEHLEKARRTAEKDFYLGNYLANELNQVLLVPVFLRSKTNWEAYTHALDRETILEKSDSTKKIQNQLLNMIEDARNYLQTKHIITDTEIFMCGFSASASFANRFTAIFPEKVKAMAAGGLNASLIIPKDSLKAERLNFPLGVADFDTIFEKKFNFKAFAETPQFLFMGENDTNDAVPYKDAYSESDKEKIFKLFGEQMIPERWENMKKAYQKSGVKATFKTYSNTGHECPENIKNEIVLFFKNL